MWRSHEFPLSRSQQTAPGFARLSLNLVHGSSQNQPQQPWEAFAGAGSVLGRGLKQWCVCVCVSDVGRLVERGPKRGQGKGCREPDTTGSPETCPERLRVGEGEQDGQDGQYPWGHSWRMGVGTGMQWIEDMRRQPAVQKRDEEGSCGCGYTRSVGAPLVFEVDGQEHHGRESTSEKRH